MQLILENENVREKKIKKEKSQASVVEGDADSCLEGESTVNGSSSASFSCEDSSFTSTSSTSCVATGSAGRGDGLGDGGGDDRGVDGAGTWADLG